MRRSAYLLILVAGLSVHGGCSRSQPPTDDATPSSTSADVPHGVRFRDMTEESGVVAVYENGEEAEERSIVESLGGGVGMFDFDQDGRLDLLFPGGGEIERDQPLLGLPNSLWRNLDGSRFEEVSTVAEIHDSRHYTHGCAAADYDNDGFVDVVLTGYGGLQFFRNQGDGTFAEWTEAAGIRDTAWSSSAAWGDFDGDGNLDLYVAHYVDWSWDKHPQCPLPGEDVFDICAPSDFRPLPDTIYFNEGDGTFRAAGTDIGLAPDGKGLGVIAADLDLDSHLDIYVANDTTNNFLFINQGDGTFRDMGLVSGTALDNDGASNGSMGLAVFDFDHDLMPDVWVTNYENETFALYRNNGGGSFLWATERSGVNALGTLLVGFGTVACDLDLDGDEDVVVANGHVMLHPRSSTIAQKPLLLLNSTKGYPSEIRPGKLIRQETDSSGYFTSDHRGRGVVCGDLDNDGDLDLVFSHTNEPASLLANETATDGSSLTIRLIGTDSNRDAIGTRAVMKTNAGSYVRSVMGGGSYLSQSPYTLSWGLPPGEEFVELEITWPNGATQSLDKLSIDAPNVVVEP